MPPGEGRPGEDLRGVGVAVRLVAVAAAGREVAARHAEARVVEPEPDGHGALHVQAQPCTRGDPSMPCVLGTIHSPRGAARRARARVACGEQWRNDRSGVGYLVAEAAHDAAADAGDAGAADEAGEVGADPDGEEDADHLLAHHAPVVPAGELAATAADAVPHRVNLLLRRLLLYLPSSGCGCGCAAAGALGLSLVTGGVRRRRRRPVQRRAHELVPAHPDALLVRAQHVPRAQRHHLLESACAICDHESMTSY